jgi:hypothetical protein
MYKRYPTSFDKLPPMHALPVRWLYSTTRGTRPAASGLPSAGAERRTHAHTIHRSEVIVEFKTRSDHSYGDRAVGLWVGKASSSLLIFANVCSHSRTEALAWGPRFHSARSVAAPSRLKCHRLTAYARLSENFAPWGPPCSTVLRPAGWLQWPCSVWIAGGGALNSSGTYIPMESCTSGIYRVSCAVH